MEAGSLSIISIALHQSKMSLLNKMKVLHIAIRDKFY
jgi:hypothetical protein